ncbi:MAG: hypothetical protein PHX51_07070 [Clostridia bacterium]|nr:hypothetical protein [Clostridia bacterium]
MKTRIWKQGKFRIVERKQGEATSYDLQYKTHHTWQAVRKGMSKEQLKTEFNIDLEV